MVLTATMDEASNRTENTGIFGIPHGIASSWDERWTLLLSTLGAVGAWVVLQEAISSLLIGGLLSVVLEQFIDR